MRSTTPHTIITFALGVLVGAVGLAALPAHADSGRCDEAQALDRIVSELRELNRHVRKANR